MPTRFILFFRCVRLAVPLILIMAVGGCAASFSASDESPADLPPPSQLTRLPDRLEMRVEQLQIHSDVEIDASHRLLHELVQLKSRIHEQLGLQPSGETIHIYLYENQQRLQEFAGRLQPMAARRAYFIQTDTTLSVHAAWTPDVATDLRHEVTHAYIHSTIPRLPLWLDEGLAEYFEVEPGQGGWNQRHAKMLGMEPASTLSHLERLSDPAAMTQHDYASSWAWVHHLLHHSDESKQMLRTHLTQWKSDSQATRLSLLVQRADLPTPSPSGR